MKTINEHLETLDKDVPDVSALATIFLTTLTTSKAMQTTIQNLSRAFLLVSYWSHILIEIKEAANNSIGTSTRSLSFELQQTIRLIQSVQTEINNNIQIKDNDQLIQSKFVVETLINQSQYNRRMGLTDLLNSINARSAKR